uniref:MFS transporter n=1 Tax=Cyberlindnera americana TaxID=36016 RepID=A0A5P8N8Q5_9ASCO|nr:MFS transporter [Cyberlindnera americana]
MGFHIDPRPETFKSAWQEAGVIFVVCMAQLLTQAGASQCLPMMDALAEAFPNVTNSDKVWFMSAFSLTAGAFILISGKFGDLYGLKKVLICGTIWSFIWTLITGFTSYTDSVIFFCVCRGLHGIGIAFVLPTAIGVAGTMYPNGQRKALVFSAIGGMAPIGATLGAIFSGLMTVRGHWEWVFYSNAIGVALLGVAAYFVIPSIPRHAPVEAKMDWVGSFVGVAGLLLFNVATNQAPEVGWNSAYVIVLVVVGVLLLVGFCFIERKVQWPLVPPNAMSIQIFMILLVVAFGWASFSIFLFYYWSFNMNLRGYSALKTGATYVSLAFFGVVAASIVGFFIRRVRPSFLLLAATIGFLIGIVLLSVTPVHQTFFILEFIALIILPFGMDLSFPAASLVMSDKLPKEHQGMASSLVSTMTNYATSVSLGFASTAQAKVYAHTSDLLKSYRAGLYVGIGFAGVGCLLAIALIILSYVTPHKPLEVETEQEQTEQEQTEQELTTEDIKSEENKEVV